MPAATSRHRRRATIRVARREFARKMAIEGGRRKVPAAGARKVRRSGAVARPIGSRPDLRPVIRRAVARILSR